MTQSTTATETETEVGVKTWTSTYNFVVNETVTLLMQYVNNRGLDSSKLTTMREQLEDALWTWLSSRHLSRVRIEVYEPEANEATECFDLAFDIERPQDLSTAEIERIQERKFDSYHEEVLENLRELDAPPDDCTYRILVWLRPTNDVGEEPPTVDGWSRTTARSTDHLEKTDLGDAIDTPAASATAELYI